MSESQEIHRGFIAADAAAMPAALYEFLEMADGLPEFQDYKRRLRARLAPKPGETVLDVGCGVGFEACRLAAEHPTVTVIGLNRAAMLAEASRRGRRLGVDVRWLTGEAEAIPLPDASVDACLTERVLKYLPDPARGIAEIVRVLRPGGRVAHFELDYGATLLGGDQAVAAQVVDVLCESVGEAQMGRRLPAMLHDAGLSDVSFQPIIFHPPWAIHEAAVSTPVREAVERGRLPTSALAWLAGQAAANAAGLFTAAFVGFLVSGRRP